MLTARQAEILRILVADYVATATPVASEHIARRHGLGVSPATVRNEMATLEERGFITRPHTSAGAVPTDRGYRYFVESLAEVPPLPLTVRVEVRRRLSQAERDLEAWTRLAAEALAGLVRNIGIVSFPRAREARLRHLELVLLQDFLALLILVLQQARLRKELLPLKEPLSQEELTRTSNKLNDYFTGLTRREMMARQVELSSFEERVLDTALRLMREEDEARQEDLYLEGLRHLLSQPEFAQAERVKRAVEVLEERRALRSLLEEAISTEAVQVLIGQENPDEALWPFSVVVARYGIPGEAMGAIAVLGPTRMPYPYTIAGVRYISTLMSELVETVGSRPS